MTSAKAFDVEALNEIDGGRLRIALQLALKRILDDCKDRPNLKKTRQVSLKITMVPVPDEDSELDSCNVGFQIVETVPKRETKTFNMQATRGGALLYQELSPENPRQTTMEAVPPRTAANDS